jgi:hypothetical protein
MRLSRRSGQSRVAIWPRAAAAGAVLAGAAWVVAADYESVPNLKASDLSLPRS